MTERILRSTIDLAIASNAVAQANGNGNLRIEPCIRIVDGKKEVCKNFVGEKGGNLCNYREGGTGGLIMQNGGIDCPRQWGRLRLVDKSV